MGREEGRKEGRREGSEGHGRAGGRTPRPVTIRIATDSPRALSMCSLTPSSSFDFARH